MGRTLGAKNKKQRDPNTPKKPRKPRAAKAAKAKPAEPETTAAPAASSPSSGATSGSFKKPSPDQVQKLVKSIVAMGNESRSISQAVGEKIAKAVETQHFDKKALGMAKSLYQMAQNRPEAFAITLPHLLAYIDDLDLVGIADKNRGLPINGEDDDGQTDLEEAIAEHDGEFDDGPESLVDAMASAIEADGGDFDETPITGPSPRLSIVPGPNAPAEVPPADDEAAA